MTFGRGKLGGNGYSGHGNCAPSSQRAGQTRGNGTPGPQKTRKTRLKHHRELRAGGSQPVADQSPPESCGTAKRGDHWNLGGVKRKNQKQRKVQSPVLFTASERQPLKKRKKKEYRACRHQSPMGPLVAKKRNLPPSKEYVCQRNAGEIVLKIREKKNVKNGANRREEFKRP